MTNFHSVILKNTNRSSYSHAMGEICFNQSEFRNYGISSEFLLSLLIPLQFHGETQAKLNMGCVAECG